MQEVKVRFKVNHSRYLGVIEYPARYRRFSDFLNEGQDFLKILHPESIDPVNNQSILLVNKKSIFYIHSIVDEYSPQKVATEGDFFKVTLSLKKEETIKGFIFCPHKTTDCLLEGILRQPGFFLKIKNPFIVETSEKYNFLAVGKSNILTMEIDPIPCVLN